MDRDLLTAETATMPDKRLVFHIGLEKTGTTSLQACLHRNPAILKRHSILYPKRNAAYGWENHKPLVGCYGIDEVGDKWLRIDHSRRRATVASLIGEIAAAPERTAVVSAEHFSSRFRVAQITELRDDFARFDCRVVIVVRDHVSRLCSAYESYVTNGGVLRLDDFAEGMMRPGALDLRYAELIEPWVQVFGRDRVDLVAYGPRSISDVLAGIAPDLADEAALRTFRLRVSASPAVVAALRLANAAAASAAPEGRAKNAAWARGTQVRLQVKTWLQEAAEGEPASAWALDGERLARLNEIAELDTARLEAAYGFVLAQPDDLPIDEGGDDTEAAGLLARALVARAAKPWTKASLRGTGFAAAAVLRDEVAGLRRKLSRASKRGAARADSR